MCRQRSVGLVLKLRKDPPLRRQGIAEQFQGFVRVACEHDLVESEPLSGGEGNLDLPSRPGHGCHGITASNPWLQVLQHAV